MRAADPAPRAGKRVLHIITGLGDGGAEGALYRLCKFDPDTRHAVISLMSGGKYEAPLAELGVRVETLGMTQGRPSLAATLRLRRLIKEARPDVVQTWLYHGDLIGGVTARLAGVPQVVWGVRHSTLLPGKVKSSTMLIARLSARLSWFVPNKIISCSHVARDVHVQLGYDASKFRVIPNGYDLSRLTPDSAAGRRFRHSIGLDEDLPLLGMVSRFDPQKDHRNLLDALKLLIERGIDFRCVLVGTGMDPQNPQLLAMLQERQLESRVILLGRRDDIPDVMNGLGLHLLSSASEAFPNVLAEAMACGTPCVTTDVGDAAMIVGELGWVVPAASPGPFAGAIQTALRERADRSGWQRRRRESRARIESQFEIKTMVDAYHACWDDA